MKYAKGSFMPFQDSNLQEWSRQVPWLFGQEVVSRYPRFLANVQVRSPAELPSALLNYFHVDPKSHRLLTQQEQVQIAQVLLLELDESIRKIISSGKQELIMQVETMSQHESWIDRLEKVREIYAALGVQLCERVEMTQKIRNHQQGGIQSFLFQHPLVAFSDMGVRYKPINQDALLIMPNQGIAVVVDGMGGLASGEVASMIAVDFMEYALKQGMDLAKAIVYANEAVLWRRKNYYLSSEYKMMGASLAAVQIKNGHLVTAHLGDTKVIVIRSGRIVFATQDHTQGQDLLRSDLVDHLTAHELNHILTRGIGLDHIHYQRDVEINYFKLKRNDRIMLMTDGVSDNFYTLDFKLWELAELLGDGDLLQVMSSLWGNVRDRMINGVLPKNLKAKPDNYSAVCIEYLEK